MLSTIVFILNLLLAVPATPVDGGEPHLAAQDSRVVWLVGQVKRAGRYEFENGMTVGILVERAGGFIGTPSQLHVMRTTEEGKNVALTVDLTTALRPNDTLLIGD